MAGELRSAAVLLLRKGQRPRLMIFDDYNDAYDTMKAFCGAQQPAVMVTYEHFGPGEKPADLPMVQQALF